MASLENLKQVAVKPIPKQAIPVQEEFEDEDNGDEELASQDMIEGLALLTKCLNLMNFLADRDLCKSLTIRERDSLGRLSDMVREFLDDKSSHYEEEEE